MNTETQMKSVEQLKLEAQQAAEALRAAEQAAARAEREAKWAEREAKWAAEKAKREAEEKIITAKMEAALRPIAAALAEAKVVAEMKSQIIITGGPDTTVTIEREESPSSSYHRAQYTGRFVVCVGERYRDMPRVRYPQKKDGTFNVTKIVATILERIAIKAMQVARRAVEQQKIAKAQDVAAALRSELGVDENVVAATLEMSFNDYRGKHQFKRYTASPGMVYVKVGSPMLTPEQARVLVAALAEVKRLEPKSN